MMKIRAGGSLTQYTCDLCEGTTLVVGDSIPAGWYFPLTDKLTFAPEYTGEHFCPHCRQGVDEYCS